MTVTPRIRYPHAQTKSLTAQQVAKAYHYPTGVTGKGFTCGIVELGGGFGSADLEACGIDPARVTAVEVGAGRNKSDGPNGADGEVLLDIEVVAEVAPGAQIKVYFGANTDSGFLAAIQRACAECDVVSISWGGPESSWTSQVMTAYDVAFQQAKAAGVTVFCASGDSGADDGTGRATVDFPASSPNVVGCGGTRLTLDANGERAAEVTWDDNDTTSATGGGVSGFFPGRQVPDVAGNADPQTGYEVVIDGGQYVIGGTSAVAPLYAGLTLLLLEAVGSRFDFLGTVMANPGVCFDVVAGDNGAYRAGPGRDQTTGFGVVDGDHLLTVLGAAAPTPPPVPTPTPSPDADAVFAQAATAWLAGKPFFYKPFQRAVRTWLASR